MFNIKDIETIKGYNKLSPSAKTLFKAFLINYMDAQGTNSRESLVPISVKHVEGYLRFDYVRYGHKEWLHVKGSNTWY
ncbi:hypothetical protein KPL28_02870 [Clostridium algidicarnis]|uniref:hypothetical protein n=1 Tax=Clostridium algidicarnis TaxID=37659 RepID=UPI001C0E6712|nr:hypothetical protein [Clostridium algidicarnis]MBU3208577.1 hypothetical protein [Clostridium algidicarnis]